MEDVEGLRVEEVRQSLCSALWGALALCTGALRLAYRMLRGA